MILRSLLKYLIPLLFLHFAYCCNMEEKVMEASSYECGPSFGYTSKVTGAVSTYLLTSDSNQDFNLPRQFSFANVLRPASSLQRSNECFKSNHELIKSGKNVNLNIVFILFKKLFADNLSLLCNTLRLSLLCVFII